MKTYILFMLSLLSLDLAAQVKQKDTLFFKIDKYYTISPALFPDLANKTYPERIDFEKIQMKETQTNGYIHFVNDFSIKGLKPKKVLSLKKFIENKEFYLNGRYNKIVDNWKLKKYLADKYILFFVNGDEFIKPERLEYISYYPIRNKDGGIITNMVKDTLYFTYDKKYIITHIEIPNHFYIKDGSGASNGDFCFIEIKRLKKPTIELREIGLKKFIHTSEFYNKKKRLKLNDFELYRYFNNYVIVLVKDMDGKKEYIQVGSGFEIE